MPGFTLSLRVIIQACAESFPVSDDMSASCIPPFFPFFLQGRVQTLKLWPPL